jgi:hypothetical protein
MAVLALLSPLLAVGLLLVLHRFEQWLLVENEPTPRPDVRP